MLILEKELPFFKMLPSEKGLTFSKLQCFCGYIVHTSALLERHFYKEHNNLLPNDVTTAKCFTGNENCRYCDFRSCFLQTQKFHLFSAHQNEKLPDGDSGGNKYKLIKHQKP